MDLFSALLGIQEVAMIFTARAVGELFRGETARVVYAAKL